jgi:cell fate (sporulation/competence/biofilm development) regulator YlbF (YheA/YmcA/DUF963 family)
LPSNPFGQSNTGAYFASLYSLTRQNRQAEQNAADQDAFDRWQNGLMDDQTWLAYIATRISQTASDPTQHQKWVTAQRKYVSQIADNQAEFAYQNGGDIGSLIGYYTAKLGRLDTGSQEYRNVQLRVNDLMDKRAANDINDGSERIQNQIADGTATYADLLRFYREHLSALRPSSDLYKQVTTEMDKVNDTIKVNTLNGEFEKLQYEYESKQLTGAAYAAKLRTMAEQFKVNDPQKYYQLLEAAVKLDKVPGLFASGSGGGGGGAGSALDLIRAQTKNIYTLVDQFEKGSATGKDWTTGADVTFTPAIVQALDRQMLTVLGAEAAALENAGASAESVANVHHEMSLYITTHAQPHNTIPLDEQRQALILSTSKWLASAAKDPDPLTLVHAAEGVTKLWGDFATGLTQTAAGSLPAVQRATDEFITDTQAISTAMHDAFALSRSVADSGDPNSDASDAAGQVIRDTLRAVLGVTKAGNSPSGDYIIGALIDPVALGPTIAQGLSDGTLVRIVTPAGFDVVRTRPVTVQTSIPNADGTVAPSSTVVRQPVDADGNLLPMYQGGADIAGWVKVYVDINGTPTEYLAPVQSQSAQYMGAFAKEQLSPTPTTTVPKGAILSTTLASLGPEWLARNVSLGNVLIKPVLNFATVIINGVTFLQDPFTGSWYKGDLPIRGGTLDPNGLVKWDGVRWSIDWKAYSSADGMAHPFLQTKAGDGSDKLMQNLADSTPGFYSNLLTRGIDGEVRGVFDPAHDTSGQYYWGDTRSESGGIRADELLLRDQLAAREALKYDTRAESIGINADMAGALGGIETLARQLGINFGIVQTQPTALFTPSTGTANYDTRSEAFGGAATIPPSLRSVLPTNQFDPAAVQTYSGPNITGTVAPTITSVTPAAPVITIPQPPATYAPPAARIYEPAPSTPAPVVQWRNPQIYPYPTRESM